MTNRRHFEPFSKQRNRRQDKRQRQLARLANMRAAKARKREQAILDGWNQEPKMVRAYRLEFGVRDKLTGETAWADFKSVRDAARRLGVVLKYWAK